MTKAISAILMIRQSCRTDWRQQPSRCNVFNIKEQGGQKIYIIFIICYMLQINVAQQGCIILQHLEPVVIQPETSDPAPKGRAVDAEQPGRLTPAAAAALQGIPDP